MASFYMTIYAFLLLTSNAFAEPTIFKAIKDVENSFGKTTQGEEFLQRPEMIYKGSDFRDPFKSYIIKQEENNTQDALSNTATQQVQGKVPPSLTVQGLVWGGDFPQAIINNKVVRIGETIEAATVKAIDKGAVTLIFEGKEYKLPVAKLESSQDKSNLLHNKETF